MRDSSKCVNKLEVDGLQKLRNKLQGDSLKKARWLLEVHAWFCVIPKYPLGISAQAVTPQEHHPYAKEIVGGRASNFSVSHHCEIVSFRSGDVRKHLVYHYKCSIQVSCIQKRLRLRRTFKAKISDQTV